MIPLEAKHTITVLYLHFKSHTVHLADSIFLKVFFPHTKKKLSDALKALLHSAVGVSRRGVGVAEQKGL